MYARRAVQRRQGMKRTPSRDAEHDEYQYERNDVAPVLAKVAGEPVELESGKAAHGD